MKLHKSEWITGTATALMLLYVISVILGFPAEIITTLLFLLPVVTVIMILVILRDPRDVDRTFDEYFYEDMDIRRNVHHSAQ